MGATKQLSWPLALLYAAGAIASFHLAFALNWSAFVLVFLFCIVGLTEFECTRKPFYFGLAIGFAIYAPHLAFFWGIFGPAAVALWFVLAFWLGIFLVLAQALRKRFGVFGLILIPFVWTGIEYFRSELYYLRFSWLSVGYAFSDTRNLASFAGIGVYGIGFCLMLVAVAIHARCNVRAFAICLGLLAIISLSQLLQPSNKVKGSSVRVAGIQFEDPAGVDVLHGLDKALAASPYADLFVMCEYTFHTPVPNFVMKWCAQHKKYLAIGATDPVAGGKFYDTAFVIGPNGNVVFKQAKKVPVQFFKDGLPAREQKLWDSPWGKIGLGICYDCSYRNVADELVRQGAQALIFPTSDVIEWGAYEHRLHARVAPMRAAEYGIGIVRLASSGISEIVGRDGTIAAKTQFPGQGNVLLGTVGLSVAGRLPLDHWLAPFCTGIAGLLGLYLLADFAIGRKAPKSQTPALQVPVAKV